MKLADAVPIASAILLRLKPYCHRIEVAGSIRRGKAEVGDIELVAIPKMLPQYDMFGKQFDELSLLYDRKLLESFGKVIKFGKRYVQIDLWAGIKLDLFVVLPPAQWGVIMAIRTGPADFSHWLVTPRSKGGALPIGWRVEDGRVWDGQVTLDFPEEDGFLTWLGLGGTAPGERKAEWHRFRDNWVGTL